MLTALLLSDFKSLDYPLPNYDTSETDITPQASSFVLYVFVTGHLL